MLIGDLSFTFAFWLLHMSIWTVANVCGDPTRTLFKLGFDLKIQSLCQSTKLVFEEMVRCSSPSFLLTYHISTGLSLVRLSIQF